MVDLYSLDVTSSKTYLTEQTRMNTSAGPGTSWWCRWSSSWWVVGGNLTLLKGWWCFWTNLTCVLCEKISAWSLARLEKWGNLDAADNLKVGWWMTHVMGGTVAARLREKWAWPRCQDGRNDICGTQAVLTNARSWPECGIYWLRLVLSLCVNSTSQLWIYGYPLSRSILASARRSVCGKKGFQCNTVPLWGPHWKSKIEKDKKCIED